MRRYRAVLFDVDGTLLDTSEGLRASLLYTIGEMGLPPLGEEEIRGVYSAPADQSFAALYGLPGEEVRRMAGIYRAAYRERFLPLARVFPGIPQALEALRDKGFLLATASLKREAFCRRLLREHALLPYFHVLAGQSADYGLTKRDILLRAAARLGLSGPEEALLVGDSKYDAEGAALAGADFLAVTYGLGFSGPEELAPYAHVGWADSPEAVARLLLAPGRR